MFGLVGKVVSSFLTTSNVIITNARVQLSILMTDVSKLKSVTLEASNCKIKADQLLGNVALNPVKLNPSSYRSSFLPGKEKTMLIGNEFHGEPILTPMGVIVLYPLQCAININFMMIH